MAIDMTMFYLRGNTENDARPRVFANFGLFLNLGRGGGGIALIYC